MDKTKKHALQGLYGITDTRLTPKATLFWQAQKAVQGGVKILQYRDKDSKDSEISSFVAELAAMCAELGVLFVLNDRYELALKLGVSGLHLGKDEVAFFESIRADFGGIIGVSCYDSIPLAQKFENLGADYVAFGAFFPSTTKPNAKSCAISLLQEAKKELQIPICGIGGISPHNAGLLKECDMIAVIGSLWQNFAQDRIQALPNLGMQDNDYSYIAYNAQSLIAAWQ